MAHSYFSGHSNSHAVPIPGTLTQINFFNQDLALGKVKKDANTAYILYIGGNDLGATLLNDVLKLHLTTFFKKLGSVKKPGTIAENVKTAVDTLIQQDSAQHIYVFLYMNIANLPRAYHVTTKSFIRSILLKITTATVNSYNKQLVAIFNSPAYKGKVTVINVGGYIDSLAQEPQYIQSVKNGLRCDQDYATATQARPNINNCNYDNNQIYFAWNDAHLTTAINQDVAYQVYQVIKGHQSLKKLSTDDSKEQA